ncbi:MAG: TRAP transporter small permease subunit [Burkholderiaceae bacterium]|nr:TRAP transporter small permease subunit [Burkholderiaceae bacterium]
MNFLLALSRAIDALNDRVGRSVLWLVLASTLISAGNATVRKAFNISSNAMLEIQWYLYAAVFVLAAGYTLLNNEHVRIDVLSGRLPPRGRAVVDLLGAIFFLLPFVVLVVFLSWHLFWKAYVSGEMSSNAGGLIRWPVYLIVPVGFTLLGLQGISEAIKRIAFLAGRGPDPAARAPEAGVGKDPASFVREPQSRDGAADDEQPQTRTP